ncbi:MAG: hypothetical protein VCF07_02980 [Nitrospinota bacterium]
MGDRAEAEKELCEPFVAGEQICGRHGAAIRPRRFMYQIVGNDRFKAREVIKKKNLAGFYLTFIMVKFDIEPKTLFDN